MIGKKIIVIGVAGLFLSGCVDLTAVATFAKESSAIASNKAALDDTAAQTQLRAEIKEDDAIRPSLSNFVDPTSKAFIDRLAVTHHALDALNAYMDVLAQLSAKGVADVSAEVSSIGSGLQSLKVTDPAVQSGLNASGALVNILLDGAIRSDAKKLVAAAGTPVDQITAYLVDQAQTTSNTYSQAIGANNKVWGDLAAQSAGESEFCAKNNICKPVFLLATLTRDNQNVILGDKVSAADAAVKAFKNIRRDNAALVSHVQHLDDKGLAELLKADEPDLMTAIRNLKSL